LEEVLILAWHIEQTVVESHIEIAIGKSNLGRRVK
jgi:hypothetical protein